MKFKKYSKDDDFTYSFGIFPTIELIKAKKTQIIAIICHEKLVMSADIQKILNYASEQKIEVIFSSKQVEALSKKENCFVIGVFKKYSDCITRGNHVVLVSPQDSGNLGTIVRTMLGMNIENLAIIKSGKKTLSKVELEKSSTSLDIFSPKVIRASMGSIFNVNIQLFDSFDDYEKIYKDNQFFAFCLNGKSIKQSKVDKQKNFSLIFGNEATGLGEEIIEKCAPVKIEQSNKIDSYNLAISVALGLYEILGR